VSDLLRKRIIIVEDDLLVAEELKEILSAANHVVIGIANSGAIGIGMINRHRPDTIFLDIKLEGELNGLQVVSILERTVSFRPKIIIVSAFSPEDFGFSGSAVKHAWVRKPYTPEDILRALKESSANCSPVLAGP
jgi:DNA-binding response OmpR family regulator